MNALKPQKGACASFLMKQNSKTSSKLLAIFSNLKELRIHYRLFCKVIASSRKFFSSPEDGDTFMDITSKLDKNIASFKDQYMKCFEQINNQNGSLVLIYFYCRWVKIRIETCRVKKMKKWEEKLNKSLVDLMTFTIPNEELDLAAKHEILWYLTKQWEKKLLVFPPAKNNQMIFDLTNQLNAVSLKTKGESMTHLKSSNQLGNFGSTIPTAKGCL